MKKIVVGAVILIGISSICFSDSKIKSYELGLNLGAPTGPSGKFFTSDKFAVDFTAGWMVDFMLHLDWLWHDYNTLKVNEGKMPLYYGGGIMFSESGFHVQGKIGIEYMFETNPLGILIEIAPAVGKDFVFQGAIGVRYRIK